MKHAGFVKLLIIGNIRQCRPNISEIKKKIRIKLKKVQRKIVKILIGEAKESTRR